MRALPARRPEATCRSTISVGLALQLGTDFEINQNWFVNVDLRYIDIDSDADLDDAFVTTVDIDPWVVGLNIGWHP